MLALILLHVLPDAADPYLAWAMVLLPLGALAVLAWSWRQRLPVSKWELEYLRVGIAVLTIAGIAGLSGGALPLTLIAGPALFIWTVVDKRRIKQ